MASITLDDDELDRLAQAVADRMLARIELVEATPLGWLDTKAAAEYAGCTVHALHKATAAREVRFAQDSPGGKCRFRSAWLDDWREGRPPDW